MKTEAKHQLPFRANPHGGGGGFVLEGENKELFIKLYPTTINSELSQLFGVSGTTVAKLGHDLGIKKDRVTIAKKVRAEDRAAKQENGYYESSKFKRLSEMRRQFMLARIASGLHPTNVYKRAHPDIEWIRKCSERRRELVRKERTRVKYGMEQKTKCHFIDDAERRAGWQKRNMIRHYDYFADPAHPNWVCYDKDTRRSAVCEATAIRRGLEIVEGE